MHVQQSVIPFNDAWGKLSAAILQIYRKNASSLSFEELYRNAYNLVFDKHGDKLYSGVEGVIRNHLADVTRTTISPTFPVRQASASTATATSSSASSSSTVSGGPSISGATPRAEPLLGALNYLKVLRSVWEDHIKCMIMIRDILFYMDKVYAKPNNKFLVYDLGLVLFRDTVLNSPEFPVLSVTIDTILDQIFREREGEIIDRLCVKSVIDMFLNLNTVSDVSNENLSRSVYDEKFEPVLLEHTRDYYRQQAEYLIATCNAHDYMVIVERQLAEESNRVQGFLSHSSEPKTRAIMEEVLITNNLSTVIEMPNSGLVTMLSNDKLDDLRRMYLLFGRTPQGHEEMRKCISGYIKTVGKDINESVGGLPPPNQGNSTAKAAATPGNPLSWVDALLAIRDRLDRILDAAFERDRAFLNDFNAALVDVVNANPRAPEFLSLFIDDNLKKGQKAKTEAEVDATLDKTVTVFKYLTDKDVFERYYKQHLAKRLLQGRSVSEDSEKGFISKLKLECGSQFTAKLEGMFNDMRLSQDMMAAFKSHLGNLSQQSSVFNDQSGEVFAVPELSVNVLTSTFWPNSTTFPCQYPPLLTHALERFQRFYLGRHNGRRLAWLPHMGTADLRANLPKGRKELNVTTLMMVVLLQAFNPRAGAPEAEQRRTVTLAQVAELTGVPPGNELRRALQSLSLGKHRVLVKTTKGRDVADSDGFQLNLDFSSPLNKIKILMVSASASAAGSGGGGGSGATGGGGVGGGAENEQERGQTLERVEEERRLQVEAAVVRTMKSRRVMEHNALVAEVLAQLTRFAPSLPMIKLRIESLIEREYIERDATESWLPSAAARDRSGSTSSSGDSNLSFNHAGARFHNEAGSGGVDDDDRTEPATSEVTAVSTPVTSPTQSYGTPSPNSNGDHHNHHLSGLPRRSRHTPSPVASNMAFSGGAYSGSFTDGAVALSPVSEVPAAGFGAAAATDARDSTPAHQRHHRARSRPRPTRNPSSVTTQSSVPGLNRANSASVLDTGEGMPVDDDDGEMDAFFLSELDSGSAETLHTSKSVFHWVWDGLLSLGYLVSTGGERVGPVRHIQLPTDMQRDSYRLASHRSIWGAFTNLQDPSHELTPERFEEHYHAVFEYRKRLYLDTLLRKRHNHHHHGSGHGHRWEPREEDRLALIEQMGNEWAARERILRRNILTERGPEGDTILHHCLLVRQRKMLRYLLGYGEYRSLKPRFAELQRMLNATYEGKTFCGEHAAHIAVVSFGDNLKMLNRLLARGADMFRPKAKGIFFQPRGSFYTGENVLTFAAVMGHQRIVNFLVREMHYDVNVFDSCENNVLHVLSWWGFHNNSRPWYKNSTEEDENANDVVEPGKIYHQLATGNKANFDDPVLPAVRVRDIPDFVDDEIVHDKNVKKQIIKRAVNEEYGQEECDAWIEEIEDSFNISRESAERLGAVYRLAEIDQGRIDRLTKWADESVLIDGHPKWLQQVERMIKRLEGNSAEIAPEDRVASRDSINRLLARLTASSTTWGHVVYEIIDWEMQLLKAYEPPLPRHSLTNKPPSATGSDDVVTLTRSVDPSVANLDELTPLGVAAHKGNVKMVKALLDLYSDTLWAYGPVVMKAVPLAELDTYVERRIMNHSRSALELAVANNDTEILTTPIFKTLLLAKWTLYGWRVFLYRFSLQVIFMLIFTAMLWMLPNGKDFYNPPGGAEAFNYTEPADNTERLAYLKLFDGSYQNEPGYAVGLNAARAAMELCLALWSLLRLGNEVRAMRNNARSYFGGFSALENYVELLLLGVFAAGVALRFTGQALWESMLWGIYSIIGWSSLLNYTKGFSHLGPLAIVVWEALVGDTLNFGFILVLYLLGMSQAFWLLMGPFGSYSALNAGSETNPGYSEWKDWMPGAFVWSVRGFFGQGPSYNDFLYPNSATAYARVLFL
ncbi:Cullin-3, partial [Cladochytrium tenue]